MNHNFRILIGFKEAETKIIMVAHVKTVGFILLLLPLIHYTFSVVILQSEMLLTINSCKVRSYMEHNKT